MVYTIWVKHHMPDRAFGMRKQVLYFTIQWYSDLNDTVTYQWQHLRTQDST